MPLFASVNIIFPDTSAAGGDTLIYPVYAQNVQPEDSIYGGQFWISLTQPILTPIRVFQGDITGDWGMAFAYDSTTYKLVLVMWGGTALRSDGVLFNIKFAVDNPETTTTTYIIVDSCYLIDEIANPVQLTVDTGVVAVTHVGVEEESYIQNPVKISIRKDGLFIASNLPEPVEVRIFGIDGRLERKDLVYGTRTITSLPDGIHFLIIRDRDREILRKKVILIR